MPRAELAVTIPESVWMGELSRAHPNATFEILTVFPQEEGGVALSEVTGPDADAVVSEMDAYDEVRTVDLLQRSDEAVLVQFETSEPVLLLPVRNAGTPLELPFTVTDGRVNWEVRAPRSRLSRLADQLREFGIEFDVVAVHQELETNQLLTEKQEELVQTAVEAGYYDTPRECTLTELAEKAGIAKSTCSETLHRAEEKIIKQFVEESTTEERAVPLEQ
jgi:predicted DNA binding protein